MGDIPPEFTSYLREVDVPETCSDEEILQGLGLHTAVKSEKNIWAFWDKGVSNMPGWCQRNIFGWYRMCSVGDSPWEIRILDAVPGSPNHARRFVPDEMLPPAFVDTTMTGPYIGPHSADFLRGALLYLYGGVFMDVGIILLRHLDRVGWNELERSNSPYGIAVPVMYDQVIANHFVMARKNDPFIKRWHDLFIHLWKDRTHHRGIIDDPLLSFAPKLDFRASREAGFHWKRQVEPSEVFDYIAQVLAWIRLTMLEDTGDGFSGSEYWQSHVFAFDALHEDWAAESMIGFDGEDLYKVLQVKLSADAQSPASQTASKLVWSLLSSASMQKITRGKNIASDKRLGLLWDEDEGSDDKADTFARLLRYGSLHFQQTRTAIKRKQTPPAAYSIKSIGSALL